MTNDMPKDIVNELRVRAAIEQINGTIFERAADEIERLRAERDKARQMVCCTALPADYKDWKPSDVDYAVKLIADQEGWDCFNTPETKVAKTLNGVIIDAGKAVPPHYEDLDNG
jgi:hypothetical protein